MARRQVQCGAAQLSRVLCLYRRTSDKHGVDTYVWRGGPFPEYCRTFTGNREIAALLYAMGPRYNASNATTEVQERLTV